MLNNIKTISLLLCCCIGLCCSKHPVLQEVAGAPTNLIIKANSTQPYSIYLQVQYPGDTVTLDNQANLTMPYTISADVQTGDSVGIILTGTGASSFTFTYKGTVIISRSINAGANPVFEASYKIP